MISRFSSTEVISFLLRVTCVIFERAIDTDVFMKGTSCCVISNFRRVEPLDRAMANFYST